jgi:ZIP family zinc transporter
MRAPSKLSKVWLFIIVITIHNFPEGMVVGVNFGNGDFAAGLVIALRAHEKLIVENQFS